MPPADQTVDARHVNIVQALVAPAPHDAVDAGDADVIAGALADPALNRCDSVVQVDGTDTDTKNVDPVVADWAGGP